MARWSALPTWWIRDIGLTSFTAGKTTGVSIAAIKVLVAISLFADFSSHKIQTSISNLETLTGLSRPMVLAGISMLESKGLVVVDRAQHINEYQIVVSAQDTNWAKLPFDRLKNNLHGINNRGAATLAALKVYLLLVSKRPNSANHLAFSHENIRQETGIQTRHVRQALDILINHSLLHISSGTDREVDGHSVRHNVYTLLGIDT